MSFTSPLQEMGFVPRALVPVPVGRLQVHLYPTVDSTMPIFERAHAFHINKTALSNLPIELGLQLDILGTQMNSSASVEGMKADWFHHFNTGWKDFRNMTILSFHNSEGTIINDTTVNADGSILRPVVNGPLNACRKPDVKYVRVQLTLDFLPLVTLIDPGLTILRVDYYIELPQTSVAMVNNAGNPYQLVTYHGPDDLRTLTPAQLTRDILQQVHQDNPLLLRASQFNLTAASTDSVEIMSSINDRILRLAYNQIVHSLFNELCPNYSDQPHAALEQVKQTFTDRDGVIHTSSVHAYYQKLRAAARPFSSQPTFPVSLCNKFIDGLDPRLMQTFRDNYPNWGIIHPLDGRTQKQELARILAAAVQAELKYAGFSQIARDASLPGQAYTAGVQHILTATAAVSLTPTSLPSQAESTLAKYKKDSEGTSYRRGCFGCGGPHSWAKKVGQDWIPVCPHKDEPGIAARAQEEYDAFKTRRGKKNKNKKNRKRKDKSPTPLTSTANLDDYDSDTQARWKRQAFATQAVTEPQPPSSASSNHHVVYLLTASVFTTSTPLRPPLPIAIQQLLPHIDLQLGSTLDDDIAPCPFLKCAVDTCAGLSTGNFHHFAKLAKCHPECISRIMVPEDYSPILLSGVVRGRSDSEIVTTELNIGFELYLPYLNRDGATTAIGFATGTHVTVNAIIGLPFITAVGMIIDTVDQKIQMKYLNCGLFDIEYKLTSSAIPIKTEPHVSASACSGRSRDIIEIVTRLENFILGTTTPEASGLTHSFVSSDTSFLHWVPPGTSLIDDNIDPCFRGNNSSIDDLPEGSSLALLSPSQLHTASPILTPTNLPVLEPIRVTPKPKRRHKLRNVFVDDRGFPDESDEYDRLLSTIDGGTVLRKLKHPSPPLDIVDPSFNVQFDDTLHGPLLDKYLDLRHLEPTQQAATLAIIKQFWAVFDESTAFVPVKNYECVIDTGTASPIAVKKILYGPREIPIMRKSIAALEKVGHIRQIYDGRWLFKALLAPKPHQEQISNIDDFVWRFCINYIPLNQVTKLISYPIPRCDSAVWTACGTSKFHWIFDAVMGYHQLAVDEASQEKLAFQGTDAIKWTYNVMPFGPTNGPATFISFIHDLDSIWKRLAVQMGLIIDDDTNTTIVVDDIFSWAKFFALALRYMECQLRVCKAYRLSLSLKKSHFFPARIEFVGIDVCTDGNRPAMSKFQLIKLWPQPIIVRDVAKFVGFGQFYSRFIPYFEVLVEPLREIMKAEYTQPVAPLWTDTAQAAWDAIKDGILSDPCLQRFDSRKLTVIRTDFSSAGFGYVVCQPANDNVSIAAMHRYMNGQEFDFMRKDSKAILQPVAFGSRRTRGNESHLHSHLGEGFAGDWAINKCRHLCFGQRFVWITDCYAIKFILSYDGGNPAILRLQMRLMCWDMAIIHRTQDHLVDADYWSRLGADLCYDPLLRKYLTLKHDFSTQHLSPTQLPMLPQNMPYFRGPRVQSKKRVTFRDDVKGGLDIANDPSINGISIVPVTFCSLPTAPTADPTSTPLKHRVLYNADIPSLAYRVLRCRWAIYCFNTGHFISSIATLNLPYEIVLACDPLAHGRSLFSEFTTCPHIFPTANDMLTHIRSSGDNSTIDGYMIHSHRLPDSETTRQFWQLQASIIKQFRIVNKLSVFVAFAPQHHDHRYISSFVTSLTNSQWLITTTIVSYPSCGDSVADSITVIIGIHSATMPDASQLHLKLPPSIRPPPLAAYLWEPFNTSTYIVSYAPTDPLFNKDSASPTIITTPKPGNPDATTVHLKYHLHLSQMDPSCLSGAGVYDTNGLCPPFDPTDNTNIFGHLFGVEFNTNNHTCIRPISQFEFVKCFSFTDALTYRLSHPDYQSNLDCGIPARTSAWLFQEFNDVLDLIRDSNTDIFLPVDPAAATTDDPLPPTINGPTTIPTLFSGVTGTRLPTREQWAKYIADDTELSLLRTMILDPSKMTKSNLAAINYNFRQALRRGHLFDEHGVLFYAEPLQGNSTNSYTKLAIVPNSLQNIIFVAFHSNPIGGHFDTVRTLHRIRLRFYWPHMYQYINKLCRACPGCALANPTHRKSYQLVYNFPIEAPFKVLYVDGYNAGKFTGFEDTETYVIACCGMCTFACMEPVIHANSTSYASAVMKIQLRFGFCHTIVLDKDSKFLNVFREALDLLQINTHVLSGGNHNPMLVERINRYLNKGLKIMTNERDSVRVAMESILLLLYAWNSCPVPGTDISRSMVAVGREFAFPIDFSTDEHLKLTTSSPSTVVSYSKDLAIRLSACREIATILVDEQRAWHRELINSRRPHQRIYSVDDIVFARRTVKSSAAMKRVEKLEYAYTGPWRITAVLKGASYALQHCLQPTRKTKRHASDLSPFPSQLIPFEPNDGADNRYSQIYKPIQPHPFREAGVSGFKPPQPFQHVRLSPPTMKPIAHPPVQYLTTDIMHDFHWPTLSELNDELDPFIIEPIEDDNMDISSDDDDDIDHATLMYTGPAPAAPTPNLPTIPPFSSLIAAIIASTDRLFFISHPIATNGVREWRLIRVALQDSIALSPSCLQDGRFLVDFYLSHPADARYNAINKRFWLQYHTLNPFSTEMLTSDAHLIRPSDSSEEYATRHHLVPCRCWLNVTHHDTYIHGPFEFATVRNRKTRDRISQSDWTILSNHTSMFTNPLPLFDIPSFSLHADHNFHIIRPITTIPHATILDHNNNIS